ncbi:MAG: hypothetical protein IAG10_25920 [Planctomycetaceae bacterium]|nr:hypothetical protein [Planctomycetaceae bacterium]
MKSTLSLPIATLLCLIALVTFVSTQAADLRPGWKPGVAGGAGDIKTPVYYVHPKREIVGQMIVLSNDKGAAAVRFSAEAPTPGVVVAKYEYRCESFDGRIQRSGVGELFEQRDDSGTVGGNVHLSIADLFVSWSPADHDCCWIYYTPEKVRLQVAEASLFKSRVEPKPFQPGEFVKTPALDLRRFK